jgi:hypothetical protein
MLLNGIYAQLLLIGVSMSWFALSRRRSKLESFIKILSIVLMLLGLWLGGIWVYPPAYGLAVIAIVFFGLMVLHFKKAKSKISKLKLFFSNAPLLLILPLACFMVWQGLAGRQVPVGEFVELDPPFRKNDGACVLSGGISPLLNFHIFPSDRPRDLGQQYALDIIKVGPSGFRVKQGFIANPKPTNIEAYEMFENTVYSPCDGVVVDRENKLQDQPIGGSDKISTGGNGIVLQCGNYHVHLHHMKQGSVLVDLGDEVKTGQEIGEIGNSGNTLEPHLHLHVETVVKDGDASVHGSSVHMKFGDRFMARGDCF